MLYMKTARSQKVKHIGPSRDFTTGQRSLLLELFDIVYHHMYFLQAIISVLRTILLSRFIYSRGS
jgi:hypothetical protein